MAQNVVTKPITLTVDNLSPKYNAAATSVSSSLKIPAIERVNTLVLFKRKNSLMVIKNAINPGNIIITTPPKKPFSFHNGALTKLTIPSEIAPHKNKNTAMGGAMYMMVLTGSLWVLILFKC